MSRPSPKAGYEGEIVIVSFVCNIAKSSQFLWLHRLTAIGQWRLNKY